MIFKSLKMAAAIAVLSIGGAAAEPFDIDVGNGKTVDVDPSVPLKLALFIEIGTNSAAQSTVEGVRRMSEKYGFEYDVLDARLDIIRQVNLMQNALTRDYNAWIVAPVEGTQVCDMVTNLAPDEDILVVTATGVACGRATEEGEGLWSPGTLAHVGGNETPDAFRAVMERAVEDNPGPIDVALLTGPALFPITMAFDEAVMEIEAKYPNFNVVATYRTDYSPPDNQIKVQTLLQAQPELDVIIGAYTNMSKGAVPALEAAGMLDKVKVYEAGGTEWSVEALKKGWIQATTGFYRRTAAETAVEAILAARAGEDVPRVFLNDGHPLISGQIEGEVGIVTLENVDDYIPQSP